MSIDSLKCCDYEDFSIRLSEIEKSLESEIPVSNTLNKILEFIEINQDIFIYVKKAAICLDSMATKARHLAGNEQLIGKLRHFVNLLIPSRPKETKDFLQLIRSAIVDPSERLQAIVDWVDLMRIPLAQLELTEEEFIGLVTRLEYPDLTNFDYQSLNWEIVTKQLLTTRLKFRTIEVNFLSTLAKFCAQQDVVRTTKYIQNFAIRDEQARIEIAKLCAKLNSKCMAECIQNFVITDERARLEIAKLCALEGNRGFLGFVSLFIRNFALGDPLARIEIAKLCADLDGEGTALSIQNFKIEDEEVRIEIAKICANQNGRGTALFIEKFIIGDELARIEIAKLCAQNDGKGTSCHIQNFAISDELARIDIAKLCAEQNGRSTAESIQNFAISSELARVDIAKICANQDGGGTVSNIGNFAITNEQARVAIAKICAKKNGGWTALHINNFAINDKLERIAIAKLCASHDAGGPTAVSIKKFAIEDEKALIEIAKICARRSGRWVASFIQNFAISNELVRIEIAKICAQQDGKATAQGLDNFQIGNLRSLYEVFLFCVQKDPKSLFHMKKIPLLPTEFTKISPLIQILNSEEFKEPQRKELFDEIKCLIEKISISNENRKVIMKMNDKIQALPTHAQNAAGLWLVSSFLFMKELKPESIEWLMGSGLWNELGLLKDPGLRVSLSVGLDALSADSDRAKLWKDFLLNVRGVEGQRGLMLLAIPFFSFQSQGIDGDKLLAVANNLSTLQRKKKSSFRDAYRVKNLLHTMHSLASRAELTAEQKQHGFEKIFFHPSSRVMFNDERQILKNVIAAKGLLHLKDTHWPHAIEDLNDIFRSSLEKIIPLEQFKGDVSERYEEIFGKCRNPSGLLSYAAGLKTLGEPALLSCLGQYVVWVMNSTFQNRRYHATDNPHLAKLLEGNPDLLSVWKEEIKLDLHAMIFEDKKEESFDSIKWLRTKLVIDNHLNSEELPYLMDYLITSSAEYRNEIFSALIKEMKGLITEGENEALTLLKELEEAEKTIKEIEAEQKKDKGNEDCVTKMSEEKKKLFSLKEKLKNFSASNKPALGNLNLQKACLRFAQEGEISDRKSLINHLEEIDQSLASYNTSEFAIDVKGLLETLKNQAERSSDRELQVVFTDDPIDLLLCGTDINGSCQRLDGDPKLNRGLLGYLIDGKIRLLAIKEGNKIVARCLLRLLWDGEQPVVFRDRFYPDQIPDEHKQVLNILAKQVSQKMAVPLTCEEGATPYNNTLQALGGPSPYEYCDGAGGVQKEGRYTIEAKILD